MPGRFHTPRILVWQAAERGFGDNAPFFGISPDSNKAVVSKIWTGLTCVHGKKSKESISKKSKASGLD
jgi:hypothetical protein